jgi:predicted N-acetyltransferase YhbS
MAKAETNKGLKVGEEFQSATITVLNNSLNVEDFDCGDSARNSWLCTRAFANQRSDDTRTYVAIHDAAIVGFYAMTVGSIVRSILPGSMRRNAPDPISCVLLAQLAVSLHHQGQGLSRELVLHGMRQAVKIADLAGCRLFAVHPARSELVPYYAKFGFSLVETTPALMVMSLQKVRATLAAVDRETSKV